MTSDQRIPFIFVLERMTTEVPTPIGNMDCLCNVDVLYLPLLFHYYILEIVTTEAPTTGSY